MVLKLKEIWRLGTVKFVIFAVFARIFIDYIQTNQLPDLKSFLLTIIIIGAIGYLIRGFVKQANIMNYFVAGAATYILFILIILFFKLTEQAPVLTNEITSAFIFGGLTAASFWVYDKIIT